MNYETRPRIYVASLSDYNAGRLHGRWIDAAQATEEIESEVKEMLAESPEPIAEEWAIHDYEGFGPLSLSEWESFERVSTIALLIKKHGKAFAAWVADDPGEELGDDTEEQFLDAFCGEWDSEKDYAEELAREINPPPDEWDAYIDWESYANTLFIDSHFSTPTGDGTIYVFWHR